MKEQLDLVKILKDCPKGMPLDCEIFNGTVTFSRIVNDEQYPIEIKINDDYKEYLTKYGNYVDRSFCKCVIFPKGKNTWEGFQRPFVDGDIVFYNDTIAIFKEWGDETLFRTYVVKGLNCEDLIGINTPLFGKSVRNEIRFATEEEKQILFKALEENRYKWNSKTKSLEKLIAPKFKVGDKIRHKTANIDYVLEISRVYDDSYGIVGCGWMVSMEYQNEYELVPNKTTKNMEENKINQMSLANCDLDEVEIVLGDRFELKIEDGKYYAVRKKPKYPTTYDDCCDVIGISRHEVEIDIPRPYQQNMFNLFKLLICRDAYWKIAGEYLELNKPWEPDFSDDSPKYNIFKYENKITLSDNNWSNRILVFPTLEMRYAFYENFKDLIEQCKELL